MDADARIDGIPVRQVTVEQAVGDLLASVTAHDGGTAYRLINAYSLALASRDPQYHQLLASRGVNLPDGKPLTLVLRRFGFPKVCQVRGSAFLRASLEAGVASGVQHFFLGGSPELLEQLVAAVRRRFPGIAIAGVESPPFRPLAEAERGRQDMRIAAARPDIVWVGLGTPQQDFEAQRIADDLGVCTAGVGAAFDFLAGTKPEAPAALGRLGLEWLFRLATEPKRLWRRYLFGNLQFLKVVVDEGRRRRRCVSR